MEIKDMLTVKRILAAIDLHEDADAASLIETAADLVRRYGARLLLVNVLDVDLSSPMLDRFAKIKDDYVAMAQRQLRELTETPAFNGIECEIKLLNGRSYAEIIAAAHEVDADLILVAAHKETMSDYVLGTTAARVVRHSDRSVLVIRT
jgi:nucleotide-binding universal stress UspA family protein